MKAWIGAVAVAVALTEEASAARLSDYRCTIDQTVPASNAQYKKTYIGKQFTVERQTGLMAGALKNSYFTAGGHR